MTNVFLHIAVDEFGAECLGKFSLQLDGIQDPTHERHWYIWAGVGDPPQPASVWDTKYPAWDEVFSVPVTCVSKSVDVDRGGIAKAVYDAYVDGELRHRIIAATSSAVVSRLGRAESFRVRIILAGSFADPFGSGILLGSLFAFSHLRHLGQLSCSASVIAGIGRSSTDIEARDEVIHALAAQSVCDFQNFCSGGTGGNATLFPIYLVGERGFESVPSQRVDQVAIAGLALFAFSRSSISKEKGSSNVLDPFFHELEPGGNTMLIGSINRVLDPRRPFTIVGAYAVSVPMKPLAQLLAARLCKDVFMMLTEQPSVEEFDKLADIHTPGEWHSIIRQSQHRAMNFMWQELLKAQRTSFKDPDEDDEAESWLDMSGIETLISSFYQDEKWDRIISPHGWDRIKALPLQHWNDAVEEFVTIVDEVYVEARNKEMDTLTRRVVRNFLGGLDIALSHIFEHAFQHPVHRKPHAVAQAFLGSVVQTLTHKREQLRLGNAETAMEKAELKLAGARLEDRRKLLVQAIEDVPSPIAVILRIAPLMGVIVGIAMVSPLMAPGLDSVVGRIIVGCASGFLALSVLFGVKVSGAKRALKSCFEEWLKELKALQKAKDRIYQREAVAGTLDTMKSVVRWFFEGETEDPPLPNLYGIVMKKHPSSKYAQDELLLADILRRQVAMKAYNERMKSLATRYCNLMEQFVEEFQDSHIETSLPAITVENRELFDVEYQALFPEFDPTDSRRHIDSFMQMLNKQVLDEPRSDGQDMISVFAVGKKANGSAIDDSLWRRKFEVPGMEDVLNDDEKSRNSGYQFFRTVERHIRAKGVERYQLASRLAHESVSSRERIEDHYRELSQPSAPARNGEDAFYVIGASVDDPLPIELFQQEESVRNSDGRGKLSLVVQAKMFVSAEDIIDYAGAEITEAPIARAWSLHKTRPFDCACLKPVTISELGR